MVTVKEIDDIYKKCGVNNDGIVPKITINTGSLANTLNCSQVTAWNTNIAALSTSNKNRK